MSVLDQRAPSRRHIIETIARREIRLASGRKGVRALFIMSLLPLAAFALILVIRVAGEATMGADMGWDPVKDFMEVQIFPVILLALALGPPIIAEDRSADVLFLYATRPVGPFEYVAGKLAAVAIPVAGLLLLPGAIIAGLRFGILPGVGVAESLHVVAGVCIAAVLVGFGLAGIMVTASALTRRGRWSLLLALAIFFVPAGITQAAGLQVSLGAPEAISDLLGAVIDGNDLAGGVVAGVVLVIYGVMGLIVPLWRVRGEMTP